MSLRTIHTIHSIIKNEVCIRKIYCRVKIIYFFKTQILTFTKFIKIVVSNISKGDKLQY